MTHPATPAPRFDVFYRHDALTRLLSDYVAAHPQLVSLQSIGRSHEGRDIQVVVVTNTRTGADTDKPAFWVDGNIHAAELTASTACLYFLDWLVRGHGHDERITRLLDTRTIYLCPRLNPDGAELALAERPRHIRSSTRRYPFDEPPVEGLTVQDIDGDGRVLTMRQRDPHGGWKKCASDPRLMVPREAIVHRSEVTAVYVVDTSGRPSLRQVRTGTASDERAVEVLAGVRAGEAVALDPVAAGALRVASP